MLHEQWNGKIETTAKSKVNSREDLALAYTPGVAEPCKVIAEDKEAAYNKINTYKLMDDEYIDSATSDNSKYKNKSCNRLETKENYNVPINRRMYSDLDDEYARGFKR